MHTLCLLQSLEALIKGKFEILNTKESQKISNLVKFIIISSGIAGNSEPKVLEESKVFMIRALLISLEARVGGI
ncbi:hypothetical protein AYI69_g3361 [Smittium culicis]|uniref:Uncharacterized protein n=1 Tax=Smittium culicis TaxID=133412 RepID=A0A1R1YK13_9FUNG|nr:hypothetical protein AYI69_g3361 [Smittium culicis]